MKHVFISGIPASGKSYLARRISQATGAAYISVDDLREEMKKDPALEQWVNFYWDQDEEPYYKTTSCEEQWANLKRQSEAFWPTILEKIMTIVSSGRPTIFEGVNILPHLAAKDLSFPGIVLLGKSFEEIYERVRKEPRWGKTEALQRMEAEAFFYCERLWYKKEAERFGFKTFEDNDEAEKELLHLLK